jgi:hypothetical protein
MRALDRKSMKPVSQNRRRSSRKFRVAQPARSPALLAFVDALQDILRDEAKR